MVCWPSYKSLHSCIWFTPSCYIWVFLFMCLCGSSSVYAAIPKSEWCKSSAPVDASHVMSLLGHQCLDLYMAKPLIVVPDMDFFGLDRCWSNFERRFLRSLKCVLTPKVSCD
jgi:hypothetical protein